MPNKFLKAIENNQEIGHLEYVLAADEAQLINIFIEPPYRKKGHASNLLKNFIEKLNKKYSYIILEVRQSNLPAINLYEKFNFKKINLRKNYYSDPVENAVILKLNLINRGRQASALKKDSL